MPADEHKVAIIGASYAGLALANLLQRKSLSFEIFDKRSAPPHLFMVGGYNPPPSFLTIRQDFQNHQEKLTREIVFKMLYQPFENLVHYEISISSIFEKNGCLFFLDSRENQFGPFRYIIGADGVKSVCRVLGRFQRNVLLIGDARWALDRFWDLGMRRIREGAEYAMRDAIELAELLGKDGSRLGKFSAKRKFAKTIVWTLSIFLIVVAIMWKT